ncbi:response regulator transcription factor [Vibrio alginolyticus]|nr:response regulator transcription factor [Vibrio alginolyticus]
MTASINNYYDQFKIMIVMEVLNTIYFIGEAGCAGGVRFHSSFKVKETVWLDILYKRTSAPMVIYIEHSYYCKYVDKLSLTSVNEHCLVLFNVPIDFTLDSPFAFANVKGLIYKGAKNQHFEDCLNEVNNGGLWLPRKVTSEMLNYYRSRKSLSNNSKILDLSSREQQVMFLVANGNSNKEISEKLFLATTTVKKHLSNIFKKLNVKNRDELTGMLMELPDSVKKSMN